VKIVFSENMAEQICAVLYEKNIQSLIVEGGAKTLQTFIDAKLWDEALVFKSNISFGEGISAPLFTGKMVSETKLKNDSLQTFKNENLDGALAG